MSRTKFSPEVLQGLKPLNAISADDFKGLLDELERTVPVSLAIEEEIEKFLSTSRSVASMSEDDRHALGDAFFGIQVLRLTPGATDDSLMSDVEDFLAGSGDTRPEELERAISNFRRVMECRVLRASVKALNRLTDHDRLYLDGRILTDVRPVYDDDVSKPLMASLVIHTLKLITRSDGRPQSIYVAMDTNDLRDLKTTIDRALDEAAATPAHIANGRFAPMLDYPQS